MKKMKNEVVAAIIVGSDFLRMSIAQIISDGNPNDFGGCFPAQ